MKLVLALLLAPAAGFSFGGKKAAAAPARAPTPAGTIATPARFTWGLGNPGVIADRAAAREAKDEAAKAQLIPTPARFMFAFGRLKAVWIFYCPASTRVEAEPS